MLHAYTFLAPNMFAQFAAVADYLAHAVGEQATLEASPHDSPLHDPRITEGTFAIAFMCGLPMSIRLTEAPDSLTVLGAAVPAAPRYQGRPIYYSDLLVRADSPYHTFTDLRGARFCYNDPASNSGYNVIRHFMLQRGLTDGFFGSASGSVFQSGSHQKSIAAILEGRADVASIDTLVFDRAAQLDPTLLSNLRAIETLGPFPIPPVVVNAKLPSDQIQAMRAALLALHDDPAMGQVLRDAHIDRYVAVNADDYMPLYDLARDAEAHGFMVIK